MRQEIEMTKEQQVEMYMNCSKKELYEMLIEANRQLKNLPLTITDVSQKREDLITTLICTIDDLLPEDHWVRLCNSYKKLRD